MRILVDMDGVLADWDAEWDLQVELLGDAGRNILRSPQRRTFDLFEGLSDSEIAAVKKFLDEPGYYRRLRPLPGALEGLWALLLEHGHEVFIVTTPWLTNPTCASDKLNWFIDRMGKEWAGRVILTSDKTIIEGDYLIDDKPEIKGVASPSWTHVLFDRPHNQSATASFRMGSWAALPEMLEWASDRRID